jgi:putative hydrolase of the HAD superfamily
MTNITAAGFDIDGTLYPPFALYGRLIPFTALHLPLMLAFKKTRDILHARAAAEIGGGGVKDRGEYGGEFYRTQARLLADFLHTSEEHAASLIENQIYRDWTARFKNIRPYPYAAETVSALKTAGFKLGILSDFPIREKLIHLGLAGFWDTELCAETEGALKPSGRGFLALARALDTPPQQILYVGNSYHFDIEGAAAAGMKTALRASSWQKKRRFSTVQPDIVFSDYRELKRILLGS